jgi:hypothetical protein
MDVTEINSGLSDGNMQLLPFSISERGYDADGRVDRRGYYSCHRCDQWPCSIIENFGLATGLRIMKRTIPLWHAKVAEFGDENGSVEWARMELERCHCAVQRLLLKEFDKAAK